MGDPGPVNGATKYDPTFTKSVIEAMGPKTSPRMRQVMNCLIQHVHDFAREIDLTTDEFMQGIEILNWAGKMSDDKRNEGMLVWDVIGLESLVDEITYKKASETADVATQSAVLGPFFRHDAPHRKNGDTITFNTPEDGEIVYMHGTVRCAKTKKPLANASIDVWQASTNGYYESQDDKQVDYNLRGKFFTDENGQYAFYCLRPTPYPIPHDGPAGKILQLLDRHPYRPAHIHLIICSDGYKPITTQIFDKDSKYLKDDSVFAVKDQLTVEFTPLKAEQSTSKERDKAATSELIYDINMAGIGEGGESGNSLVTTGAGVGY